MRTYFVLHLLCFFFFYCFLHPFHFSSSSAHTTHDTCVPPCARIVHPTQKKTHTYTLKILRDAFVAPPSCHAAKQYVRACVLCVRVWFCGEQNGQQTNKQTYAHNVQPYMGGMYTIMHMSGGEDTCVERHFVCSVRQHIF